MIPREATSLTNRRLNAMLTLSLLSLLLSLEDNEDIASRRDVRTTLSFFGLRDDAAMMLGYGLVALGKFMATMIARKVTNTYLRI